MYKMWKPTSAVFQVVLFVFNEETGNFTLELALR